MPKLPVVSGQRMIAYLQKEWFILTATKWSHHKLVKQTSEWRYITTVPLHKELDQLTLKSILRQSHIDVNYFLETYKENKN